jgi:hypothetical protein
MGRSPEVARKEADLLGTFSSEALVQELSLNIWQKQYDQWRFKLRIL